MVNAGAPLAAVPVVILAGGRGERLAPHTDELPKALLPVGDSSLLEHLLTHLGTEGFRRAHLLLSHLGKLIEERCGDGEPFRLELEFWRDERMLSTAGALGVLPRMECTFCVVNGDVLTDLDFTEMLKAHRRQHAVATVAVQQQPTQLEFGVVTADTDGRLVDLVEKPILEHRISLGMHLFEPAALDFLEPGEVLSMPDFLLRLRDAGQAVFVYETDCLWLDVGRPEDYEHARRIVREGGLARSSGRASNSA